MASQSGPEGPWPIRRMAGLVFLLVFWVLAGACQRHGVGGFLLCNTTTTRAPGQQAHGRTLHRAPVGRWPGTPGSWLAGHFFWVLVWTGACYWHGVGGFMFNSSSSANRHTVEGATHQHRNTGRPSRSRAVEGARGQARPARVGDGELDDERKPKGKTGWPFAGARSARWRAKGGGCGAGTAPGGFSRGCHKNATCCHCFSGLTPLPGICGSLAVLAGPEAGLAVWVFLRVAKTR